MKKGKTPGIADKAKKIKEKFNILSEQISQTELPEMDIERLYQLSHSWRNDWYQENSVFTPNPASLNENAKQRCAYIYLRQSYFPYHEQELYTTGSIADNRYIRKIWQAIDDKILQVYPELRHVTDTYLNAQ